MGTVDDILRVEAVAKSFGKLRVLEDVSFAVPTGQALGIVGPNGAGKTTLLSIISGSEKASAGKIILNGEDVTHLPPEKRTIKGIGRTFQIPRPFGGLTVFQNVLSGATFGAGLRGRAAEQKALEALEVSGLLPVSNELAGGLPLLSRKRLELARALATDPQVVLLDEIAGGLTEAECDELVITVKQLISAGVTVVWIEHVVHALLAVVERIICLASGQLVADGPSEEVMKSDEVLQVYLGSGTGG